MKKKHLIWLLFFSLSMHLSSQEKKFDLIDISKKTLSQTTNYLDTLLIDRDMNNWSLRLNSSMKLQKFKIHSGGNNYSYSANNPYSIGAGVGTKKIILDFAFNIKASEENPTQRFDFGTSLFKKNHMLDLYFQHYTGFDVKNETSGIAAFQPGIISLFTGVRYMYLFDEPQYSIASTKSGLIHPEKSSFTYGIGGFAFHANQRDEGALVPRLDASYDNITQIKGTAIGLALGASALLKLSKSFFMTFNVSPGVGLMDKYVVKDGVKTGVDNPLALELGWSVLLGYDAKDYYANFSISSGFYGTDFNFDKDLYFEYFNAKLVLGYKLKGKLSKKSQK